MIALLSSTGSGADLPWALVVFWLIFGVIQIILIIAAFVSILTSKRYTGGGKFLWVLIVVFMPLLGAVGWFLLGRNAQIRTDVP